MNRDLLFNTINKQLEQLENYKLLLHKDKISVTMFIDSWEVLSEIYLEAYKEVIENGKDN